MKIDKKKIRIESVISSGEFMPNEVNNRDFRAFSENPAVEQGI